MAIPAAATMTQTDTLGVEEDNEIQFSIGDPRWVMRTQADLYSNRELAVTREYSTNAFDANKQRALDEGTSIRPIEVTLPSVMNPYFKVRDYGYGMTRAILAEVYTKFGSSTKRDSNHFNGMLGYGSKSAVAYSTQFTVVSIADGMQTVAVVTRNPDWSIVMKIVSQKKSSEPSGTEITVPVHNPDEFRQKANDFYKFWLPGTVLVDGKEPKHHVGEKISEGFYYSPSWNASYVVMGNVPYRITNAEALFSDTALSPIEFVAYVDNGDVEFTPSREDLKYTDLTKKTLRKVISDFADGIIEKARNDIDTAKTHAEAYTQWKKWTASLGTGLFSGLTFKGDRFESRFKVDAYKYSYGSRNGSRNIVDWNVESADNTLFIMEASLPTAGNLKPTPTTLMKYNAQQYKEIKGLTGDLRYTLFVRASEVDCKWINTKGDNFITYADLAAQVPKKQRVATGGYGPMKNIPGSFDVYTKDGCAEEEIPVKYNRNKYFYITTSEKKREGYNITQIIQYFPTGDKDRDIKVVEVPGNRLAKFQRTCPNIKEFIPFAKTKIVKDGTSLLSQDAIDSKSVYYQDAEYLKRLDSKRLDDPEIVRYIGLVKTRHAEATYDNNLSLARHLKMWSAVKEVEVKQEKRLFTNYPLVNASRYHAVNEDVYLYINAKYAATQKKGKK